MTLSRSRALALLSLLTALSSSAMAIGGPATAADGAPAAGADQPLRRASPVPGGGGGRGGGPRGPVVPYHPGGPGPGYIWKGKSNGPLDQCLRGAERKRGSCERACHRRYRGGDTGTTIVRNGCLSGCERVFQFNRRECEKRHPA